MKEELVNNLLTKETFDDNLHDWVMVNRVFVSMLHLMSDCLSNEDIETMIKINERISKRLTNIIELKSQEESNHEVELMQLLNYIR